ncbi:MAG: DUF58 domain-containing protein [Candidatus Hatepunaea meridiana]|nr:DUF58 domain-containing protein [Candidatus Hatepunaea meridiana]
MPISNKNDTSPPISRELLRKVKLLELRTRLQVHDVFGGQYHSVFKGQGMDFAEVRQYFPGDDVRNIDWNVTARMEFPYVKIYKEERELTVMLLVDVSASNAYGTIESMKREVAAELTALLALCALTNNDKVGLLLFTDHVEHFVAAKKGRRHVLRLIRDVLAFQPQSRGTSVSKAVEYALHALNKKSVLFLLSDFADKDYEKAVRVAGRKHDLIAMELFDPREREIPSAGLIPLKDPETDEILWVNTSSATFRKSFIAESAKTAEMRDTFFKSTSIDRIELPIDKPYLMPLIKFFRSRERRK